MHTLFYLYDYLFIVVIFGAI